VTSLKYFEVLTKAVHCAVKNATVLCESWTSLSENYFSFFLWPISNILAWYFCDAFSCQ